jgi:hypothetical protein
MSFDVFLQRFVGGEAAEANRENVRAVLRTTQHCGPDEFGYYIVKFSDGVDVELSARGLDGGDSFTGCAFHLRAMNADLVAFIFEIASAGDMVLLPAMEDFVPILSSPAQMNQLPPDLQHGERTPVLCNSALELETVLTGGYAAWKKYVAQVLK